MSYTLAQKIMKNSSYGKWVQVRRVAPKFVWRNGHPAGYTDDLGIIADKNQWVESVRTGWVSDIDPQDYHAMREWCEQHFTQGAWYTGPYYVFLENEKDVAWFMLRWA